MIWTLSRWRRDWGIVAGVGKAREGNAAGTDRGGGKKGPLDTAAVDNSADSAVVDGDHNILVAEEGTLPEVVVVAVAAKLEHELSCSSYPMTGRRHELPP